MELVKNKVDNHANDLAQKFSQKCRVTIESALKQIHFRHGKNRLII